MEHQRSRENTNDGGQPSVSSTFARADMHSSTTHGRTQQWQHQSHNQGYYFYPQYAVPYAHNQGSSEASTHWHPAAVMHAPYAIMPPPPGHIAVQGQMSGPVYFAAPAYFNPDPGVAAVIQPYPHYWVPYGYPAAMMIGPGYPMPQHTAPPSHPDTSSMVTGEAERTLGRTCTNNGRSSDGCSYRSSEEELQQEDSVSAVASSCGDAAVLQQANCWGSLTVAVLQNIMTKLADSDVKQLRLVCRHWRGVVDHNLESLTPNDLKARVLVKRFSNLKVLHLTNCCDIRNRSLWIICKAGLNLHTLTLGDDATKPWVTNSGLECIAQMTSLTSLNLHECGGITNKGLAALTNLSCLSSLSLRGCRRLTNAAFEALQGSSSLTSLNLYGCRLTDKGLLPLSGLQLVSLHLGNTRVRDEGLAYLAQITTLQELHFHQEDLTDAGVAQLTSLTRLQSLALRDCAHVSSDSLSVLIPALPNLISLDLYKNFTMDDLQLTRCLEFLGAVTFLDLRGTPVTEDGLQQLTKLSSLQKLCLAPTKEYLWSPYLCVVSNLTQLTSLSINNCTLISFGQLETLRQLKLLRELDLSGDSNSEESRDLISQQSVNPNAISAMVSITSLTSIDLSRRPVHQEHLSTLAEGLPRLHTLIIVGCPVLYTEVQSLQRRFPDLIIHRKPLFFDGSCSSSDHGIG